MHEVVCDASAMFEFLAQTERGRRVGPYLEDARVCVPDVAFSEVAMVARQAQLASFLDDEQATVVVGDLLSLDVESFPFAMTAERAWELRQNVTIPDGCYVALAESLRCPLITLDERLSRAPDLQCEVIVP